MREPEFTLLPQAKHAHPGWVVASIVAHVMFLLLLPVAVGRGFVSRRIANLVVLYEGVDRVLDLTYTVTERPPARPEPRPEPLVRRSPQVAADTAQPVETVVAPDEVVVGVAEPDPVPTPVIGSRRIIGPAYAGGRLWVRPIEAELGVLEPSSSTEEHVARVDSAIRARLLAFIDTMPPDSFATPRLPEWKTSGAGGTWGIDEKWIYLGDLKLPSALLALIPTPQGNYYQAQDAAELQRIREDIVQAARRAETRADFRRYVEEVRKRKDAEREALRREREAAARRAAKRDTIPR